MKRYKKHVYIISVILGAILLISGCSKRAGNREYTYVDLLSYYGIENDNQYGLVIEGEPTGVAIKVGDDIYLPQKSVASGINSKFFYDEENKEIRYATSTDIITYKVGNSDGKVMSYNDEVYLELKYVMENSKATYSIEENPNRVVVFTEMGKINTCTLEEDTRLYTKSDETSDVMTDIKSGVLLYVKKSGDEWDLVVTETGIKGYIKSSLIDSVSTVDRKSDYKGDEYTHLNKDYKISLGWHLLGNTDANDTISEKIKNAKGLNVISPTWFKVTGKTGEISSLASKNYVKTAHDNKLEVWALVNDFEKDESGIPYLLSVLSSTQYRTNLINNLIEEVEKYDIDGINVDFENISLAYGKAYVQFMRELSIECRERGIILSVDVYVPMSFNEYYGRKDVGEVVDYFIIMGYDEHWGGGDSAGSVASISYVTNGINNTLKSVEASRVINAIPFYTRIWCETPEEKSDGSGVFVEDSINGNYFLTSKAVGMGNAQTELSSRDIEPNWLEDIGQYYGEYKINDVLYRVWLEEERSIELKLNVMKEAGLGGVACWQLGLEKNSIWDSINKYLNE